DGKAREAMARAARAQTMFARLQRYLQCGLNTAEAIAAYEDPTHPLTRQRLDIIQKLESTEQRLQEEAGAGEESGPGEAAAGPVAEGRGAVKRRNRGRDDSLIRPRRQPRQRPFSTQNTLPERNTAMKTKTQTTSSNRRAAAEVLVTTGANLLHFRIEGVTPIM